jgi:hypothetical protein
VLNEYGGWEERKQARKARRASIITHSGTGVWGTEARVGELSSFSHLTPNFIGKMCSLCVLILKVPYFKKNYLIFKNKN